MTEYVGLHRPLCPSGRAAARAAGDSSCAQRSRPYVLAATILASAMAFIDGSIVTIALPVLQTNFDASFGSLQWVVNAYTLLLGGLILVGGAAGDRFGRRRIFVAGLIVFGGASLACAAAPSVELLIAARSIEGIGAALLVPQSLAIIAAAFPRDIRGRAIGIWAGASAITTALGPPLGGVLIDWIGWRAVFWINLPLVAAALWLAATHVPESRDETSEGPLDWLGGVLGILGFGALAAGLTLVVEPGNSSAAAPILLVTGIVSLIALWHTERSAPNPLVPLSLFRSRNFTATNVITLLLYGALGAVLFLLPFDLIERRGLSPLEVGLTLLPFGLFIGIASRYAGAWADRAGRRRSRDRRRRFLDGRPDAGVPHVTRHGRSCGAADDGRDEFCTRQPIGSRLGRQQRGQPPGRTLCDRRSRCNSEPNLLPRPCRRRPSHRHAALRGASLRLCARAADARGGVRRRLPHFDGSRGRVGIARDVDGDVLRVEAQRWAACWRCALIAISHTLGHDRPQAA